MSKSPCLHLKKGKEKPLLQKHHWIYSGAIASISKEATSGDLLEVLSSEKKRIGLAFYNPGHSIAAHMIAFGEESLEEALRKSLFEAKALREPIFDPEKTNALRMVNAEGDKIPGLIVDSYAKRLVIQISHPGLERIKPLLLSLLLEVFNPVSIFEKSTSFLRKKGGLKEIRQHHFGEEASQVVVRENKIGYLVDLLEGQKTGLFLDQREMRTLVRSLAADKKVLNCFAYTGGFSIAALMGGAAKVDSVEISKTCAAACQKNIELNQLEAKKHTFHTADVFAFIKQEPLDYDLIILDPPAFVKSRDQIATAFRAYKELNREVMVKAKPGTLLVTSSCSYHIEEPLFQNIIFRAALEANRNVKILSRHLQAHDHPISIFHPEATYLKSFLLYIPK